MIKFVLLSLFSLNFLCFNELKANSVELDPKHYEKNSTDQYNLAKKAMLLLDLKGNESILDVGCGDGKITAEIAQKLTTGTIRGIDQSKSMVLFAKKQHELKSSNKITFENIKAEQINEENCYDIIICFSAIHWFENPNKAIDNFSKALKPNGKIIILSYPLESPDWEYYRKALESKSKWHQYLNLSIHHSILSTNGYAEAAKRNDLKIKNLEVENYFFEAKNLEEYKAYVKGWVTLYVPIPLTELDDYINSIVGFGEKQFIFRKNPEKLLVPYKNILVCLEKKKN